MGVRSPNLYSAVRRFCLGAFAYLHRESENDVPLSFSFEEHATPGDPAFYELRPLARSYVDARADRLFSLPDTAAAIEELEREPAAGIFAHAHARARPDEERALYRTILLPLLGAVAEACGGFDWDDGVSTACTRRSSTRCSASGTSTVQPRRWSGCLRPCLSTWAATSSCACRPSASSPPTGRKLAACCRAASVTSPSGCVCSSSRRCSPPLRRKPPMHRASSQTP